MKTTAYFDRLKSRPDRAMIEQRWIEQVIAHPISEVTQSDGRIRIWGLIPEMNHKYLRVVLLADRETVHNAFFDRGFRP
ncbi:Membrane protein [Pseudohongiella spirulinae]|uniref:Membrane protein n=1 Tax=Pseudohongiella spirulinae TaxID=1249552 RepID=A0A0S2KAI6_9GAMM|nr:hypothetical protein [Pseudohongiella spirulinae]ALO45306.1 Membrane protein [Pseudohongiella spirulinae]